MQMYTIVAGPLSTNCYIVDEGGTCAVIDPSDAKPVLELLEEKSLRPDYIFLTHGHFDHIGGVMQIKQSTGAKVYVHKDDANMLTGGIDKLSRRMNSAQVTADVFLEGGESFDDLGLRVIHTPGHSPGSISLVHEQSKTIFSGDTLFRLNVGRADFEGGSPYILHASIKDKLFALDGDYDVYPGHMRKTTLAFERERNPYMNTTPDKW